MNLSPAIIIYSVDSPNLKEEYQRILRHQAEFFAKHLPITGSYKGVEERSFVAPYHKEKQVQVFCETAKQECYLVVHSDLTAELRDVKGNHLKFLQGTFQEVKNVEGLDAWTRVGLKYYVVKE